MVVKYSNMINGYTSLNVTKLDVLDTFSELKVATAYEIDGQEIVSFPADLRSLENATIKYTTLPGWNTKTTGITSYKDLPEQARVYVDFIEKEVGVKVEWVGVGPSRASMLRK